MNYKLTYITLILSGFFVVLYGQDNSKPTIKCNYLLYLPADYANQNNNYPLIIYLHGGSQRGKDLNKLKRYGLPHLIDKGNNYDFIIASPQCPDSTFWSQIDWFDSLYRDLTHKYRIDKARIYVTGISMGGFGAWHAAIDYRDKITAIIPLCGGCNDSTAICKINTLPIWTFHGTADSVININETEKLVSRLRKCNGTVKFTRLDNVGHDIQHIYENQEIYNWLKNQKK